MTVLTEKDKGELIKNEFKRCFSVLALSITILQASISLRSPAFALHKKKAALKTAHLS